MFNSLSINSKISGKYTVNFIDSFYDHLLTLPLYDSDVFIIDINVYNLFDKKIKDFLKNKNIIKIVPTEKNKTIIYSAKIIDKLLILSIRKNSKLIAIKPPH